MHNPNKSEFMVVKCILRYLKGFIDLGLHLQAGSLDIAAFSDSDWAANQMDRRSVTGSCIFLGKNPVFWVSKKQTKVAKSSAEAEYRVLAYTAMDIACLSHLVIHLDIS